MDVIPIPAFSDNYLWLLVDGADAVVVDPGDAAPVQRMLQARGLTLRAILITHHHPDHIGGVATLLREHPVPVYGPRAEASSIRTLTQPLAEGDQIEVLGVPLQVIEVPGHTLGHIAYVGAEFVLCGDTLFSAGCGRLFEGTAAQLHRSLARLAALPATTRVYCTHEYTLANLAFAQAVEPGNPAVAAQLAKVRTLRANHEPSLPTQIGAELRFNPFLRCSEPEVIAAARQQSGVALEGPEQVFAALRRWKDSFRAPASF